MALINFRPSAPLIEPPGERFRHAMQEAGIDPPGEIIADGKLHRFTVAGDNSQSKNGWYVLHLDGIPAGCFGCWKRDITQEWCGKEYQCLTSAEKAAFKRNMEAAKNLREQELAQKQAECRSWCAREWGKAKDATEAHPYLKKKGVNAYGLKLYKNSLMVPVYDLALNLHGVQFIPPDGKDKRFKTGTDKTGHFCPIGDKLKDGTVVIAEGYATAASIHRATGHMVLVAFDAGNLKHVAEAYRHARPQTKIIIAADDDHTREKNPGLTKATEAARAVNGLLAVPAFQNTAPRGTDFNDLYQAEGLNRVQEIIEAARPPEASTNETQGKGKLFLSVTDFLNSPITATYLISGLIERDTTGQLFGPSGGGKTFTAFDMGMAVATGGETLDGHHAEQGLVLYLAGEGHNGLRRRVKAWQIHNGKSVDDLRFFHVSSKTISLDGEGIQEVLAEARELPEIHGAHVALIVIDTLARHIEGDENSTRDMGAFIKAVDSLRSAFPGSVALLVHHTGHGEETKSRSRGSSALRAAMDFEMRVDKGEITFTKMKDGELPEPIEFKLLPVVVGHDENGGELTSCVMQYGERSEQHKAKSYTPAERQAIKALVNASSGAAKVEEDGRLGALIGDWRNAFYELRRQQDPDLKVNTLQTAFRRVSDSLLEKGTVQANGHLRFLVSEDHQAECRTAVTAAAFLGKVDK